MLIKYASPPFNVSGSWADISFAEYSLIVQPLIFFIIGITFYCWFVFKFGEFVARKDMLQLSLHERSSGFTGFLKKVFKVVFYLVENVILTPFFVFLWSMVIGTMLIIMDKSHDPSRILVLSFALVASIRLLAYYKESAAQDVAKVVPFALLAVFVADASFISLEGTFALIASIGAFWQVLVYYLIFVVVLELILTLIYETKQLVK